jgi:hypothetical protein
MLVYLFWEGVMSDVLVVLTLTQSSSEGRSFGHAALPSHNRYFRYFYFPYAHEWAVAMREGGPAESS